MEGGEGGERVDDGEDGGVSDGLTGEESGSDTEKASDGDPLESRWSNLNTSYSVISKSSPAPQQKAHRGGERHVQPPSGRLHLQTHMAAFVRGGCLLCKRAL